ncbi:prenyltransferase [Candidatus Methanomassiliicoccus intestinalis]|uniref:prenyltransferase n=1 Tax=Candidatus Methanomassiliicoccus intestinalis TaxID=1406512 RepID=UPI0037DD754F
METVNSCSQGLAWKAKEVLRIAYTLPFVMAAVAGVAFAMTVSAEWLLALLIPLDVFFLAMLVNFSNDYFDHKSGVDKLRFECLDDENFLQQLKGLTDGKVYWEGNSLDRGIITSQQGKLLLMVILACTIIVSLPIIYLTGVISLVLGGLALLLVLFYTMPPVNLGARGFGELDVFCSFFCIPFFSFFVITMEFNYTVFFVSLAIGCGAMLMRIADEVPGYDAHIAMGEKNLVVRLGKDKLPLLEWTLIGLVYLMVAFAAVTNPWFLLLFLTLPLPLKAMNDLKIEDDVKYWRPLTKFMFMTTCIALLTVVALALQTLLS